jgi:DeoR/GlpR family transcriptional regulator of sugar metabolism
MHPENDGPRLDALVLSCLFLFMHDSSDLPLGRRGQIASRLDRGEPVIATSLAAEFEVSEDAIRRDLRALAAEGVCKRVYGGALPLSPASSPIQVRSGQDLDRKRALAHAALKLLRKGQTLFLDAGSTNLQLAAKLPSDLALTVVTNSVPVAAQLMNRPGIELVVIGGRVNPTVGGCVDARSIAEMRRFQIGLCFLGACALSVKNGIAGFDLADVDFKRSLLEVSASVAVMLTSTKIETSAPFRIGTITDIDHFIVERDAPRAVISALKRSGVEVRIADAPPPKHPTRSLRFS